MRVAIYCRVSTDGQTIENQLRDLRRIAVQNRWHVVAEYSDEGVSGSKGRDKRPGFDALHKAIARRDVEMVMAWSVDRLGRSLQDLVGFLEELKAKRCDLYLHQQGVDTSTPAGRALFQMLGVFAEFERSIIIDRVNAGLARARAQGKTLGRPRIKPAVVQRIKDLKARGMTGQQIADKTGTSRMTVHRILTAA